MSTKKRGLGWDGYNLVNDGKYEEALKLADSCLYFDKKASFFGRDTKAYCFYKMGKYEESFAILDKRLRFDPKDCLALLLKTLRLSYIGRYEEAIKTVNKLIRIAKKDLKLRKIYETYSIKAFIFYQTGDYNKAIKYYKEALKRKPLRRFVKKSIKQRIERCNEAIVTREMTVD